MEPSHRSTVILNIGRDPALLSTRHLVLQSAGYRVESTSSMARALEIVRETDFDLVIFCHSLSDGERNDLARVLSEAGSPVPVLRVAANSVASPDRFTIVDSFVTNDSGSAPVELLHNVAAVLRQQSPVGAP